MHDNHTSQELMATVLQLPNDFVKTDSTHYQPGYYPATLFNTSESALGISDRPLLVGAFTALLARYTQQEAIAVRVNQLQVNGTVTELQSRVQVCCSIAMEQSIEALIQEIAVNLNPCFSGEISSQAGLHFPVVMTFVARDCPFESLNHGFIWLQRSGHEFNYEADLHLVVMPVQQGLAGIWQYNSKLFLPATIQRLSGHFQTVLAGICKDAACPISHLPLLTALERHQLLEKWQSHTVNYPQVPLYRVIEFHAEHTPGAIAVQFQSHSLSYAELNQQANQLAHYLQALGVTAGDRVAVCLHPSLEIAVVLLGIFKVGAVYVPLDPTHPGDRLAVILDDTQAKVILVQANLLNNLPQTSSFVVCLEQNWELIHSYPIPNLNYTVDLNQTAYIIYTSGTTGKPKGVMASHHNLINYILATQARLGFNHQDVMPAVARFTFSISLFELLSPLVAGGMLVVLEREHILDFAQLTQTLEQLTMLHTVPSLMQRLVNYIREQNLDCQKFLGVKHIFTGGDSVPVDLLESLKEVFPNARVAVLYGCSEVSSLCAAFPVPRGQTLVRSRIGKPFDNVVVRLYDRHQNLVPVGVPGEIYVGGAGVTQGYLNRPELTQEKFVTIEGQLFYRTGDLGRFGADGNLEFLGRADFQVKLRGIRIELGDIESLLRRSPSVKEGVVTAQDLGSGEQSLVAYVVLDPASIRERNQAAVMGEIRHLLTTQLPDYMVPAAFVVLDAMPLNANQKVDRRALPVPKPEDLIGQTAIVPPHTALEQRLVEIWEAILGVHPIGIHNSFMELGGNSLLAVEMLTQIEQEMGKKLLITSLLESPTIETLATLLSQETIKQTVELVPLRATGSKPPLFCIYGILLYQELVAHLAPDRPVYGVYIQEEVDLLTQGEADRLKSSLITVERIAARYLEAIRKLQPHGPYHLAGESFGGVIAFEMAQQLQASGEEVALVALMDSYAPNRSVSLSRIKRLKLHSKLLVKRGPSYLREKAREYFKATVKPEAVETSVGDVREAFRAQASQAYLPQPYSGRVLLFRAMERDVFDAGAEAGNCDLGWSSLAMDGLSIFDVPGDHLGILKAPHVEVMAEILQRHLDEAISITPGRSLSSHSPLQTAKLLAVNPNH